MNLFQVLTNVSALHDHLLKRSLSSFNTIESRDTEIPHALVAQNGSLLSLVRINGSRNTVGKHEMNDIVDRFSMGMSAPLSSVGHKLQFWFGIDPSRAESMTRKAVQGALLAANQNGLAIDDIIEDQAKFVANFVSWEECYVGIWTQAAALSKYDAKVEFADLAEANKAAPIVRSGQFPWRTPASLRGRHASFVQAVTTLLNECNIHSTLLDAHEALAVQREVLYPHLYNDGWRPHLLGDAVKLRAPRPEPDDVSHLMSIPIGNQLMTEDAQRIDNRTVIIGGNAWAFRDMVLAPEKIRPMARLMDTITSADPQMPWRLSLLIEGKALVGTQVMKTLASILTWLGPMGGVNNRQLYNALDEVGNFMEAGGTAVRFRMSFATWAPADELKLLRRRGEALGRAITLWGNAQANDLVGDPLEGVMSSQLGLHYESTATMGHAPIEDVIRLGPWGRPASHWTQASILLRTTDGKLLPYQPGSSAQTAWLDLIFSGSGGGKSVWLNTLNLAHVLTPSNSNDGQLPMLGIIDIGRSSEGFIDLIREALPKDRRHEVVYARLTNNGKQSINPLDLQLGMRHPLPHEKSFIANLVNLLATPVGKDKSPYDAMSDLVSRVIDVAYEMFDDHHRPRLYARNAAPIVDRIVDERNLMRNFPEAPSWWEIVDKLFELGFHHEAAIAQRFAVPVIADLVQAANEPRVIDEFGGTRVLSTSECIIDAFARMMGTAENEYPIIRYATTFDLSDARVVSLDLAEVAPKGSDAANRQTAVMYMLARHVVARNFFLDPDDMPQMFPEKYRAWQFQRMTELKKTKRCLTYDEFHRTEGGGQFIRDQVVDDAKVGRKAGLMLRIASIQHTDFGQALLDQATGIWIMKAGNDISTDDVAKTFGLTATQTALLRYLTGPTAAGSRMLSIMKLKGGEFRQDVTLSLSPVVLWAFSTTLDDTILRNKLYQKLGSKLARKMLGRVFNRGSAVDEIERRKMVMAEQMSNGNRDLDEMNESIIDQITNEILDLAKKERSII